MTTSEFDKLFTRIQAYRFGSQYLMDCVFEASRMFPRESFRNDIDAKFCILRYKGLGLRFTNYDSERTITIQCRAKDYKPHKGGAELWRNVKRGFSHDGYIVARNVLIHMVCIRLLDICRPNGTIEQAPYTWRERLKILFTGKA